jgi:uncharacterized protein (TIGR02246 family)
MANTALSLFAATLALAACQPTEKRASDTSPAETSARSDTAADEQAIRGNVDHWLQLVKAKDASSISQLYTDDGAVMPPNGPIGKGRAAIQQTWTSMLQTPGFDLAFAPEQIIVSQSGDMALDRGTYRLTVAPAGKPHHDTGKYVVVWRKVGGTWKAAADIFNSDLPPTGR